MGTITIRVDDNLKTEAYQALQELDVTPSELLRQTLEYVAVNHALPFKSVLLSDEDETLLQIARKRLKAPQPVAVTLDEL
mgnify:CR=1 FL=1